MTDAATKIPVAGGYRRRGNTTGRARCPQCGLISLDSGRCQFVARHCPRCLTGRLQPVEMPELNQASDLMVSHKPSGVVRMPSSYGQRGTRRRAKPESGLRP